MIVATNQQPSCEHFMNNATADRTICHNHSMNDDEQAKLIVEKIAANMEQVAFFRAMDKWGNSFASKAMREIDKFYGKHMDKRASRWNWLSKLDPDLTMVVVIMLFGAAWVLVEAWPN